jgi:hypothetical protein
MLAFINYETVKAFGLLFFAILILTASFRINSKEKKRDYKRILIVIALVFATLPFMEAYNKQSDAQTNLQNFKRGNSFICNAGDNNSYRVSKKDGWTIENIYFIKDSLLIRADKCKEHGDAR